RYGIMYNNGDIVLIPVPFSDLSASKRRPVLVISNNAYNSSKPDIIVVAITSNLAQQGIPISSSDLITGELPKPSIIRCDKVYTLEQSIVVKSIGQANNNIVMSARNGLIKTIS
ncbi:MAG: type II toxin-antitoxin system PemK/MazF family toxin, partial [Oscillospiraceae bacterium]|nr:type II toxin-antitoxin system PemK/MazF family toxin [Oscillospiraceae bacterium]